MRLLLAICLAAAACGPAPGHPLLGEWRIVQIDERAPLADSEPGVVFRRAAGAGRIAYSATTGCNTLAGTLTADGAALRPNREGTSTTIGCSGPVAVQEDAISAAFSNTEAWTLRPDGALLIESGRGGALLLVRGRAETSRAWLPETSVETPGLLGDWRAVTEDGRQLAYEPIVVTITPIRIYSGMACAVRSWSYTAAEGRMAAEPLPTESCDLGVGPEAEGVWAALEGARSYSVVEKDRAIITAGDGRRVHLRRAPSG